MSEVNKPSLAEQRRKISPHEAREAAAEASGFLASVTITVGGEDFEVPQRSLLDDDQRERMDELDMETQSWDREPDVQYPEHRTTNEDGTVTVWQARSERGGLKVPYQKNGKLVKPPYPVQMAIALWGKDRYEMYKKLGGRATDITATLARLDQRVSDRQNGDGDAPADPKSVGGAD